MVWRDVVGALAVMALSGLLAFAIAQSAASAAIASWRTTIDARLDRVELKLDRILEERRR